MNKPNYIKGFSKLTNQEKVNSMAQFMGKSADDLSILNQFKLTDSNLQARLEEISENVMSSYMLPYSIAPNFLVNGKAFLVPMVIEESSVVAAASAAAKFWFTRGGFTSKVVGTTKVGQVHFKWQGNGSVLIQHFSKIKDVLVSVSEHLLANMKKRNGGITGIDLLDFTQKLPNYYQIRVNFETADAMGANIINSVLEEMAKTLKQYFANNFDGAEADCEIVMAILSNLSLIHISEPTRPY